MNRRAFTTRTLTAIAGLFGASRVSAEVERSLSVAGPEPSQIPQVEPVSSEGGSVIVIQGDFCTEDQVFREIARLKCEGLV